MSANKELLEKAYAEINDNIKFAEAKNAALVTLNSALLAIGIDKIFDVEIPSLFRGLMAIIAILLLISLIISVFSFSADMGKEKGLACKILKCMNSAKYKSNTTTKSPEDPASHPQPKLMFYSYVACNYGSKDDYLAKCKETNETNGNADNKESLLNQQLAGQIVDLSNVALFKFGLFNIAMKVELFGFVLCAIGSVVLVIAG